MPSFLTNIFRQSSTAAQFAGMIKSGERIRAAGLVEPQWAALADFLARERALPVVLIVPEKFYTRTLCNMETAARERTLPFPSWDILPYEHNYPDAALVATRILTLRQFLNLEKPVVVTTPKALIWSTLPPDELIEHSFELAIGAQISPEILSQKLVKAGYNREQLVEFLRSFARRGEIVDFFSPAHANPVRCEFFGDIIDEMRLFSTRDQRSIGKIKNATILPSMEWLTIEEPSPEELMSRLTRDAKKFFTKSQLEELSARIALDRHFPGEIWFAPIFKPAPVSPLKFFNENKPLLIAVEPEELEDELSKFIEKTHELYERVSWEEFPPLPPDILFPDNKRIVAQIANSHVQIRQISTTESDIDFGAREIAEFTGSGEILHQMDELLSKGKVFIAVSSDRQKERIEQKLGGKIPIPTRRGSISQSFAIKTDDAQIAVLSGARILGFTHTMFQSHRYHTGHAMLSHYGLEPGDFVVHADYGIAKFLGIKPLDIKGITSEFLQLEFEAAEKLYVPMEDFFRISPYIGSAEAARLAKLGGKKWDKAKLRTKARVFELAGELVRIYATRQVKEREPYRPAPEWEQMVKKSFVFDETEDQQTAIDEILADLESEHPMDRLLCGDVGFGKTEVALRAVIRVVAQGFQAALLVPTTILAVQHFETFSKRLEDLPINVEMLCRFTPAKKVSEILEKLDTGAIDLVIGTHKLFSDKVRLKNFGLLIVDEEQWFGVKHKEKLKSLRAEVDVLTMTATPIPRTLYFSISGIRDLSMIETPPLARRPVFTQIVPWNTALFTKAIYQELERNGQVFFVHNRVRTIDGIAAALKNAMPDVRFAVAHGQMPERKLEKTVLDFRSGKYDVLVSTAIIESGTDMPKVNTIIIDRSDRFGLSQLYQLRGRVGRADIQAYAYLVIPPYRSMTVTARKRLRALMEHSDLGSGYHLAMKDMEIRGSGNLLGKEQSGFIEEIGLDLYSKMLAEAVAELKGQKPPIFEPIPFTIDFDAYIPGDYIPDAENRIWAYQRLFTADKLEKLDRIENELADRFGKLPDETRNLMQFLRSRVLATMAGFNSVSFSKHWISLAFNTDEIPLAILDKKLKEFEPPLDIKISPMTSLRIPKSLDIEHNLKVIVKMLRKLMK